MFKSVDLGAIYGYIWLYDLTSQMEAHRVRPPYFEVGLLGQTSGLERIASESMKTTTSAVEKPVVKPPKIAALIRKTDPNIQKIQKISTLRFIQQKIYIF